MNVEVPLIDAASQMETRTMDRLVQEALRLLSRCPVPLSEARVALLGVAYKKDIGDTRMSAAYEVTEQLERYQIKAELYGSVCI